VRAAVRADLGITDDQKVVLYTPTWRDDLVFQKSGPQDFEFAIDLEDFAERLGADHVLLLRLHNMVMDRLEIAEGSVVRDVCSHPDIRDLYLAADLMVTDYSSTMFGFYFDLAEAAPTPLLHTSKELVEAIADIDAIAARTADRYDHFRETFAHLEDGAATARVIDLLFPSGAAASGTTGTRPLEGDETRADL
jgi:CDP-glycerol glycerophosphotransferase (TagB/SpsB family)